MVKTRQPYPPKFRCESGTAGAERRPQHPRDRDELGVSGQSLHNCVKHAEIDAGKRDGLSSEEPDELHRLRRENRALREEREICEPSWSWRPRRRRCVKAAFPCTGSPFGSCCQQTSLAFGQRLRDAGLVAPTGSVGNAYDEPRRGEPFHT